MKNSVEKTMKFIVECVNSSFEISSIFKDAVRGNGSLNTNKMIIEVKSHFLSLKGICDELEINLDEIPALIELKD